MMIKAVIFDMDGILIDSEDFWQEEERKIFAEKGIDITMEMQVDTYGLGTYEVVKHWYNYKPWGEKNFEAIIEDIYNRVGKRIVSEGKAKQGVHYILDFFKKKGMPIGLASASPLNMIKVVTDKLGITEMFDVVHSCEREHYEKPHPAVYISAAKMLDKEAASCLVFEDSLIGLIAAKAARMKTVSVPHPRHFDNPRYVIADLKLNSLQEFNHTHFEQINKLN
jgi:mannitol-1-/sugar-/sorbitol-6-/2-deoxyglucose-6-phosphatase